MKYRLKVITDQWEADYVRNIKECAGQVGYNWYDYSPSDLSGEKFKIEIFDLKKARSVKYRINKYFMGKIYKTEIEIIKDV